MPEYHLSHLGGKLMSTQVSALLIRELKEGAYAQAFHETHIRDKAQYLCAVIRACFPSCAGADRLPWETLVDPVPFSRYQEAVMTFQPLAKG